MYKYIQVIPSAGRAQDIIPDMIDIAREYDLPVVFEFNEVRVEVGTMSNPFDVFEELMSRMGKERSKNMAFLMCRNLLSELLNAGPPDDFDLDKARETLAMANNFNLHSSNQE